MFWKVGKPENRIFVTSLLAQDQHRSGVHRSDAKHLAPLSKCIRPWSKASTKNSHRLRVEIPNPTLLQHVATIIVPKIAFKAF